MEGGFSLHVVGILSRNYLAVSVPTGSSVAVLNGDAPPLLGMALLLFYFEAGKLDRSSTSSFISLL